MLAVCAYWYVLFCPFLSRCIGFQTRMDHDNRDLNLNLKVPGLRFGVTASAPSAASESESHWQLSDFGSTQSVTGARESGSVESRANCRSAPGDPAVAVYGPVTVTVTLARSR